MVFKKKSVYCEWLALFSHQEPEKQNKKNLDMPETETFSLNQTWSYHNSNNNEKKCYSINVKK